MRIGDTLIEILDFQSEYMFFLLVFVIMFLILGLLSRRLGDAMDYPPYYLGYFLSSFLVAGLMISQIYFRQTAVVIRNSFYFVILLSILIVALVSASIVSYKYWGWLYREYFPLESEEK